MFPLTFNLSFRATDKPVKGPWLATVPTWGKWPDLQFCGKVIKTEVDGHLRYDVKTRGDVPAGTILCVGYDMADGTKHRAFYSVTDAGNFRTIEKADAEQYVKARPGGDTTGSQAFAGKRTGRRAPAPVAAAVTIPPVPDVHVPTNTNPMPAALPPGVLPLVDVPAPAVAPIPEGERAGGRVTLVGSADGISIRMTGFSDTLLITRDRIDDLTVQAALAQIVGMCPAHVTIEPSVLQLLIDVGN